MSLVRSWHHVWVLAPIVSYRQRERMLLTNAGRVLTHRHLQEGVWTLTTQGPRRCAPTCADSRTKLNDDANNPTYILT